VLLPALLYPGWRAFVGRWTWWTLEETTLRDFLECVDRLGPGAIVDKQTGPPFHLWLASAVTDERGHPGEPSEIVFHSLDDLEKLGSTKFSQIAVDEANELEETMVGALNGRLRHKRPGQERPAGPYFLNLASNPVRRSHWLHKNFCNESDCNPVPWGKKFRPHPKENLHNLPKGYYEELSARYTPEMRVRFIEGECGPDPAGCPVFPEFSHSLHVAELKFDSTLPVIRGWDFGRLRPACTWAQLVNGRRDLNYLAAELGDNENLPLFAEKVIRRSNAQFNGAGGFVDYVDPHGDQRDDVTDKTSCDVLRDKGLRPQYRNVGVDTGLMLMSRDLTTITRGRPRAQFDRHGCQLLIEGYSGGYTWPEPRPGVSRQKNETPYKDGYYEHVMDTSRYIAVGTGLGSQLPKEAHKANLRLVRPALPPNLLDLEL